MAITLAAWYNINVPNDMMQYQLAAVHPFSLQHRSSLAQTRKKAHATQGSSCILPVGQNLFMYILQERKSLQARETTVQLTRFCL